MRRLAVSLGVLLLFPLRAFAEMTSPSPSPAPVAVPAQAVLGAVAHITVRGSVLTIMPCSYTGSLRERHFTITISAQIGYLDEDGEYHVHPYRATRTFEQGAGGDGSFSFTFDVTIPGATRIVAITGNAMVNVFTAYGIHGWFTFQYGGTGSANGDTLIILTSRWGQENTVPGATTLCGVLPDFETQGVQPGGSVPLPEPPLVVPSPAPAAPAGFCNCNITCVGHFFDTNVQVYGVGPENCSHDNPAVAQAEQMTCPHYGVGTRRECHYNAPVVAIAPPPEPRAHCSCLIRCAWNVNRHWVDIYGISREQCHFGDATVDTATRQSCGSRSVETRSECNWVE